MTIDATFWVAISFFIFCGVLIYLKVPQKINNFLIEKINEIEKELEEAEKLKEEAKKLLSDYENKIDKSQKESKEIINTAKKESDKAIIEKTKKFHQIIEKRKKITEQKILQMKKNALNDIKNINFVNADIFDEVLKENVFDFVWCNGVLHHTKDPYNAFQIILKTVKKDGYIIIGLYNKFGRIRTKVRNLFYKIFGKKLLMIFDPMLRNIKKKSEKQIEAWIKDQYAHPVESLHTFDEILGWFKLNDVEFVNSIPACDVISENENIFDKTTSGNLISRILSQIIMIFSAIGGDGGLFMFIGKKKV